MENQVKTIFELPEFDTGQYEGSELHMVDGNAALVLHVAELPLLEMRFTNVRWHRYTQLYCCETSWIAHAYFKLIEVSPLEELARFLQSDRSTRRAYKQLHHFRIFLDETGCYEFFAETAAFRELK
ncbi:hypothetical protein GTP56_16645 [Duganella sp. FT134W]|uniref:Uncharacterized protein n=1 Tax=Duganella margarita TaxID=2692170 RepID=A0A7X4KGT4_9BURK|nr:hypothetical protein [Duganella margarita]MYM73821.1 hypothetical protein [Duganella margarita]